MDGQGNLERIWKVNCFFFLSIRGYGKLQNVREKSGKSQGILRWMISGSPDMLRPFCPITCTVDSYYLEVEGIL